MSLALRLNQPVTIVHPVGGDWGSGATRTDTVGNLQQQRPSSETSGFVGAGTDGVFVSWLLFLGPAETIGRFDRVEAAGLVLEVVGQPNQLRTGRGVHHIEVELRSIGSESP